MEPTHHSRSHRARKINITPNCIQASFDLDGKRYDGNTTKVYTKR
jgi:hypothetical protein